MSAYVYPNYKTKKALKQAIKDGIEVTCKENTPWGSDRIKSGPATVEGPHYPVPHKWYGNVVIKDGFVVSVK